MAKIGINIATGSLQKEEIIVGIDLGTTNSLVAIIHPDSKQSRTITVREAARLQTFDDDFEFLGSQQDQYKMIGNAVTPKFSKVIALAVNEFFNKYYGAVLHQEVGISRVRQPQA